MNRVLLIALVVIHKIPCDIAEASSFPITKYVHASGSAF